MIAIGAHEVHVWSAHLEECRPLLKHGFRLLAADELERAGRFRRPDDRARSLLGRLVLRTVLGRYLGERPERLRLRAGVTGKPMLVSTAGGRDVPAELRFNVSHDGDWVLVAASRSREVGVDVAQWRDDLDREAIARRFFAPGEVAALASLPDAARRRAFFDCWTRKEAYIKATGRGLSVRLDQFEVSLAPDEQPALVRVAWSPGEAARWAMRDVAPATGYSAALAAEGDDWTLVRAAWTASLLGTDEPG